VHTSVVGALVKENQFYDYASKYLDEGVALQIPAEFPQETLNKLREYATKAFIAIDGSGLSRVDFFVTEDQEIYINEINTFPGFTPISMYPKLWEETGLAYGDVIEELLQLAIQRHENRQTRYGKQRYISSKIKEIGVISLITWNLFDIVKAVGGELINAP